MDENEDHHHKKLSDHFDQYTAVLDNKLTQALYEMTNDFEEELNQVTNVIRKFEKKTQAQTLELNKWRLQCESELRRAKSNVSLIPFGKCVYLVKSSL